LLLALGRHGRFTTPGRETTRGRRQWRGGGNRGGAQRALATLLLRYANSANVSNQKAAILRSHIGGAGGKVREAMADAHRETIGYEGEDLDVRPRQRRYWADRVADG
jgi:hypothetical protein